MAVTLVGDPVSEPPAPSITIINPSGNPTIGYPLTPTSPAISYTTVGDVKGNSLKATLDASASGNPGTPLPLTPPSTAYPANLKEGTHLLDLSATFNVKPYQTQSAPPNSGAENSPSPSDPNVHVNLQKDPPPTHWTTTRQEGASAIFRVQYAQLVLGPQIINLTAGSNQPATASISETGFPRSVTLALAASPQAGGAPPTWSAPAQNPLPAAGHTTAQLNPGNEVGIANLSLTSADPASPALPGGAIAVTFPLLATISANVIPWSPQPRDSSVNVTGAGFDSNTQVALAPVTNAAVTNRGTNVISPKQLAFTVPANQASGSYRVSVFEVVSGHQLSSTNQPALIVASPPTLQFLPTASMLMIGDTATVNLVGNPTANPVAFTLAPMSNSSVVIPGSVLVPGGANSEGAFSVQGIQAGSVALQVTGPNGATSTPATVQVSAYTISVPAQIAVGASGTITISGNVTQNSETVGLQVNGPINVMQIAGISVPARNGTVSIPFSGTSAGNATVTVKAANGLVASSTAALTVSAQPPPTAAPTITQALVDGPFQDKLHRQNSHFRLTLNGSGFDQKSIVMVEPGVEITPDGRASSFTFPFDDNDGTNDGLPQPGHQSLPASPGQKTTQIVVYLRDYPPGEIVPDGVTLNTVWVKDSTTNLISNSFNFTFPAP